MRILNIIAVAAVLATPVAALQITKVMTATPTSAERSIEEPKPGFAELDPDDRRPGSFRVGSIDSAIYR